MYFPLLRGRQFELIALRELASEKKTQNVVIPIIEPVKKSTNNLVLAHKLLSTNKQIAYIIVNPNVGESKGDNDDILKFIDQLNSSVLKVAFHYCDNFHFISEKIEQFQLSDCMLIGTNEILVSDKNFINLIQNDSISHVTIDDPDKNRDLKRLLQDSDIKFIRLDNLFERETRNSDYLRIESHRFSEEHKYFKSDGYFGFSDYTPLTSEFKDGGSTPRAVVIHLTYLNNENQIWIRHFTSNSNDSIANIQGKFGEAAEKAVKYCREQNITNSATEELSDYFDRSHYPGLGTVKKISIKNHLIIIANYLRSI